jgi:hypothetical protein
MNTARLALLATIVAVGSAQAQGNRSAALGGTVRDSLGRPMPFATVTADSTDNSVVTDSAGRFHLAGIRPGKAAFTIVRLGYQPIAFETTLPADSTVMIDVRMRAIQTLGAVDVTARRLNAGLNRFGYFQRARSARGSFVSPERVDSLARFATRTSQLFRDVSGVEVVCNGNVCRVAGRMQPSCMNVFVDGVFTQDGDMILDDLISPGGVAAIEVYPRASQVPLEFQARLPQRRGAMTMSAGCGSIVLWTRARAGAIGK